MANTLKTAVIGMGGIFWGHLNAYLDNPKTELIAVCEKDENFLNYIQKEYNIPYAYTDYKELLKNPEIEAVSICLPNTLHAPVSIEALEAGKHVLVEKPMALTAEEGRKMQEAERKSGKKLMISHNQRFEQPVQVMKLLNKQGAYGDIYHVRLAWRRPLGSIPSPDSTRKNGDVYDRNWFNAKSQGGGVLRDLASHLLDLTMDIVGFPELESASACNYRKFYPNIPEADYAKYEMTSEDLAVGFLKFKNGLSISLETSFGTLIEEEEIITDIYGTKMGTKRNPEMIQTIKGAGDSSTSSKVNFDDFDTFETLHPAYYFVDSILNDTPVPVPSDEGIKILEILDALYASAENKD